jgi:CRP/FNR family transcriptional regulator
VQVFAKGDTIFEQESPSDAFYANRCRRVKIFKMMPNGKDVILEVFGPGDPLGAVAGLHGFARFRPARSRSRIRPA